MPKPSKPASRRRKPAAPPGTVLRAGTYHADFVVRGERHRGSLRTSDPAEALRAVESLKKKVRSRASGAPTEESWKAAVVRWSAEVLPGSVKPSVAKRYLSSIAGFHDAFGDRLIASISTRDIADWVGARKLAGRRQAGGRAGQDGGPGVLKNASIRRDLTALSRLFAACQAWGWTDSNPAKGYDRSMLRETREPERPPSREEIDIILGRLPAGMRPLVMMLAETGMRAQEGATLERAEVDSANRRILLIRTKTSRPRTLSWATPGGDATAAIGASHPKGYLFGVDGGEPYANLSSNFTGFMRRLTEADPTIRRWHLHSLRHAFAVRWLQAGGSLYRLSKHLGHSSVTVTEANYLGFLTVEEQAAVQTAADELAAA